MSARCKEQYEGKVFKTNKHGSLIVTKYVSCKEVYVSFIETGYATVARISNILDGEVKDKFSPSVKGVGIVGHETIQCDGKQIREYKLWQDMLERCYCAKLHKRLPSYSGCTVSDNFKYFPYFKEWCNNQIGFNSLDGKGKPFQLDKDILLKGNNVYSENTCVFLPQEVNLLLTSCKSKRGGLCVGVSFDKRSKKFVSHINRLGEQKNLGGFDEEIEAFLVYKEAKESHIKIVAENWKDEIDVRVYNSLMNYKVEIND